ncbi:MAG: LytTR family DNA-binding domain-containing protein [Lachnospiraceae bacterium]|nr:LytTR family DNA-binding domain-containing protein [Lachnospiraceae bacterium]
MEAFCIAIIEDQSSYRQQLHDKIRGWAAAYHVETNICEFVNGEVFFRLPIHYHIIFIDIELDKGINGVEIAKKLRKNGYQGEIIFTTSHREYILEGYDVHAYQYLLKPIDQTKLLRALENIYSRYSADFYTIFNRGNVIRLKYRNILYITSSNHNVDIHLNGVDKTYSPKIKFNTIVKSFPKNFKQCHRTILVNMDYVSHISKTELSLLDGTVLPISATYLSNIQQAMIQALSE